MKRKGTMQLAFGSLLAALLWALPLGAAEQMQVLDPMQSHTAYWVFSERNSDYAGPVLVLFNGVDSPSFGGGFLYGSARNTGHILL